MAAITDLSDLVNLFTGGGAAQPQMIHKWGDNFVGGAAATAPVANRIVSLFQYQSSLGNGSAPGALALPDNTTPGSMRHTSPGGGRQLWLTGLYAATAQAGTFTLYDRLLHISGLSGTSTTAQTVQGSGPSSPITRHTDGVGNQIWVEIYTLIGTTARTLTVEYTNQAGTTGQTTTVTIGGTGLREAQRMVHVPLAAGDTGVRAVKEVTLNLSTGTAGDFGVNIVHPLATVTIPIASSAGKTDLLTNGLGPLEIGSDACLCWAFNASTTTALTSTIMGVNLVEK